MPNYLLALDAIHGAAGSAFMTMNGQVKEIFYAKNIKPKGNIAQTDMKVIGTKRIQSKKGGTKLDATATIYYVTSDFAKMLETYVHTGVLPYFNMQITNDDEAATIGVQTVALYKCQLTGDIPIALLDADSDMLTIDISFTFEDFEILNSFNAQPAELGS